MDPVQRVLENFDESIQLKTEARELLAPPVAAARRTPPYTDGKPTDTPSGAERSLGPYPVRRATGWDSYESAQTPHDSPASSTGTPRPVNRFRPRADRAPVR